MAFNSTPQDIIEQNINGLLDIHRSWKRVPLALVSDVKNGFAFKSTLFNNQGEGERLIRIRDVLPGDTKTYYSGMVPDGYWVNPDDIVVGMDGDFNLACWQSRPALLNQRVCRLDVTSQSYIKRFFYRVLPGYIEAVNLNTSSTTVKHLSSKTLSELLIPLPPLAEQKVIADKLDTLLAQVENTKARLERIPQILKRFRQSVLAAAVSGRLTEEWRDDPEYNDEGYPHPWTFKHLSEVGQLARGKSKHRPRNDPRLFGEEYPFIQTGEVANATGEITSATRFYSAFGLEQSRQFPAGTLCITIAANIADTAILGIDACFPDSIVGFTPKESEALAYFVKYLIDVNKQDLESFAPATAQKNINLKVLNELRLPFPSLEEQTEIVRRVDQLFVHADRIEQQVNNALARVNNLTQSILAKAFRGELTEQWRKDNPELITGENSAEALLERIKAERAAAKPAKKIRKKMSS